jgi:hypothetical protein
MKIHHRFTLPAFLILLVISTALSPATRASQKVLIDFSHIERDPDETETRPFTNVWGDWDRHANIIEGRGTYIKAATGKGGLGEDNPSADFEKCTAIEIVFVIGTSNKAAGLSFYLEDKDGTKMTWNISFADMPSNREIRHRMDLSKPDYVESPGKTPGLNVNKIAVWQLRGDNNNPPVEVLVLKLLRAQ